MDSFINLFPSSFHCRLAPASLFSQFPHFFFCPLSPLNSAKLIEMFKRICCQVLLANWTNTTTQGKKMKIYKNLQKNYSQGISSLH